MATLAWGVLAFGAVYRWAYAPLAVACAVVWIHAPAGHRRTGPPVGAVTAALSGVAGAGAVALAPLVAPIFAAPSPGADAFLRAYDFSYQLAAASGSPAHPISIAPDRTAI